MGIRALASTIMVVGAVACAAPDTAIATPVTGVPPTVASAPAPAAARPNIIFVLVDDQRFDALGFRNPRIDTPNMDRLAREGVYFENAFVTTSLCSPSRASILTGRATRNHRIAGNSEAEPEGTVFYPKYLQQQGYETALIGKWHMGHGGQPRDGFDYWLSFDGQGNYTPEQSRTGQQMFNLNGREVQQTGYITDELTDYAIRWIDERSDPSRPFFLHLAHKAVHSNFTPAERHAGRYAGRSFIQPMPLTSDEYATKPRWVFDQRNSWHGVDFPYYSALDMQSFQRRYYETLLSVDDNLGRLMAHLEATGRADDTMIVLMGDNGFMFGEHGLIDKRNAYEPSMRVPLIAWWPAGLPRGQVVTNVVGNTDIAPTMLELAGAPIPVDFDGRSFLALPTDAAARAAWNDELIYEYYWDVTFPQTPTTFAIRTGRYKYITYHGIWDRDELYDLSVDPGETRNLITSDAHVDTIAELRSRLYERLRNRRGERVVPFEVKRKEGAVLRNESRVRAAPFPAEWHRAPLADSAEK